MERMIQRLIRAAVESFPIDPRRKADILRRLIKGKSGGGEYHEG